MKIRKYPKGSFHSEAVSDKMEQIRTPKGASRVWTWVMKTTSPCTFWSGAAAYGFSSTLIPLANLFWYVLGRFLPNQPKLDVPLCTKFFPTLNRLLRTQAKGHSDSFHDAGSGIFFLAQNKTPELHWPKILWPQHQLIHPFWAKLLANVDILWVNLQQPSLTQISAAEFDAINVYIPLLTHVFPWWWLMK